MNHLPGEFVPIITFDGSNMPRMNRVVIMLGSNQGDRLKNLENARIFLGEEIGTTLSLSSVYETEPWGFTSEDRFLNQAVMLESCLAPQAVLDRIKAYEYSRGRRSRAQGYQPREIDLDILFYNDLILDSASLTIPHPLIPERKFVLLPLSEIMGEFLHPVEKKKVNVLAGICGDPLVVRRYQEITKGKSCDTIT
jgi:2-amino-4-hydroxy-6-hydroxymethyldihydropteridine diphosphokinase